MPRIVMFLIQVVTQLQLTIIKLYTITKEISKIFRLHFCLILCASFKEKKFHRNSSCQAVV